MKLKLLKKIIVTIPVLTTPLIAASCNSIDKPKLEFGSYTSGVNNFGANTQKLYSVGDYLVGTSTDTFSSIKSDTATPNISDQFKKTTITKTSYKAPEITSPFKDNYIIQKQSAIRLADHTDFGMITNSLNGKGQNIPTQISLAKLNSEGLITDGGITANYQSFGAHSPTAIATFNSPTETKDTDNVAAVIGLNYNPSDKEHEIDYIPNLEAAPIDDIAKAEVTPTAGDNGNISNIIVGKAGSSNALKPVFMSSTATNAADKTTTSYLYAATLGTASKSNGYGAAIPNWKPIAFDNNTNKLDGTKVNDLVNRTNGSKNYTFALTDKGVYNLAIDKDKATATPIKAMEGLKVNDIQFYDNFCYVATQTKGVVVFSQDFSKEITSYTVSSKSGILSSWINSIYFGKNGYTYLLDLNSNIYYGNVKPA